MTITAKAHTAECRQALSNLETSLLEAMQTALAEAAEYAENVAVITSRFNDRTGELRASIRSVHVGQFKARTEATARYAGFVENGTRPHIIQARHGMLRFQVNGETVFRRRVRHPGTKPRPFMNDAREATVPYLEHQATERVNVVISRFNG